MKVVACLLLLSMVAAIFAEELTEDRQAFQPKVRIARGFRMGAADRFSHGFGKRTGDFPWSNTADGSNAVMTDEDLASMLASSNKLSLLFVQKFVDKNGDGVITRDEIYDVRK